MSNADKPVAPRKPRARRRKAVSADDTRAKPASAQAEAGNVKLLRGDWNEAFLDEICAFPNGQFDDQVDAFADALNELALSSSFSFSNF